MARNVRDASCSLNVCVESCEFGDDDGGGRDIDIGDAHTLTRARARAHPQTTDITNL